VNNIITTLSYEEMTNTKVVYLMSYSTLVFITFSIEIVWGTKILSEVVFFFEIQNLNCSNFSYVYIDKTNKIN
jgi:hypothetical protein